MRSRQIVVDSVTSLNSSAEGAVLVVGSHAGLYAARYAAMFRVRAVIFNDASGGMEMAGVAGLSFLEDVGIAAAAVAATSARIGDGADTLSRGVISHANGLAKTHGCRPGQSCAEAAERLGQIVGNSILPPMIAEARYLLRSEWPEVWALDSASQVQPSDVGKIVLTGSHGGLLGGKPHTAIKVDVACAVFNDAGIGIDGAGISRLPALDERKIAAATVSAWTARIGDGLSTYNDGMLSAVNVSACNQGARVGMSCKTFVDLLALKKDGSLQ